MSSGRLARALGLIPLLVACSRHRTSPDGASSASDHTHPFAVTVGANALAITPADPADERWLADVELPARADFETRIRDRASGMFVGLRLEDAKPIAAKVVGGTVKYGGGGPGSGDVTVTPTLAGAEDFVHFATRPSSEELTYRADVSRAGGLRLVGNVLELVDASGTPRLRMAAPYVVDGAGRRVDARVSLDDCAADTSGAGPWGRPVTPPGRSTCRVRVAWSGESVRYPAVLDPSWTATKANMTSPRSGHTATLLGDGTVLLVGGVTVTGATTTYLTTAELFDPKTNTFAATGSLLQGRSGHVAVATKVGTVVVAGGRDMVGAMNSTEVYDGGKFHTAGPLHGLRMQAAATLLDTGEPLIAGGIDATNLVLDTTEVFDTTAETWTPVMPMLHKRIGHYLGTLPMPNGALVVAGITTTTLADLANCELFESSDRKWISTGSLAETRFGFGGALLTDGRALVAGGYEIVKSGCTAGAELYDPQKHTWSKAGVLATARTEHTLTALAGGTAVAVGGVVEDAKQKITTYLKSVEVYDPTTNAWSALPDLKQARTGHTATLLTDGRVLVAGGGADQGPVATAELLTLDVTGTACKSDATCASGFCIDAVCCETACDTACNACVKSGTGKADGTCALALAGQDLHGDCKDDGAPACKKDGLCDGKGACESYASSKCTPSACVTDDDCTSGFCADGFCCDSACDGKCEACTKALKGAGADGTCGPVAKATDPDTDCGTLGTGVCKGTGTCDGKGACAASTAGKACAAAKCSDATTLAAAAKCGSDGDCTPDETDCTPYLCDAKAVACTKTCSTDDDCSPGAKCSDGTCAKAPDGAACGKAIECTSGFCADGFCCDKACDGQCEACDASGKEGTCGPVSGDPKNGRAACDGAGTCAGTCDGAITDSCDYPHSNVTCDGDVSNTCTDGTETVNRCNGLGACVASPRACAPFGCGNDACRTTCRGDGDCQDGVHCDRAGVCTPGIALTCKGDDTLTLVDGGAESCDAYRCTNGACTTSCKVDGDCASGAKCTSGKCEPGESSGCGCKIAGRTSSGGAGAGAAALVALAFAGLRRSRKARRHMRRAQ